MEHENEPAPGHSKLREEHDFDEGNSGCGKTIVKLILGAVVLFIVAVALVFGVCLLS